VVTAATSVSAWLRWIDAILRERAEFFLKFGFFLKLR